MKKIVLSTSLLAILSAPAMAGSFDVTVGGYYNSMFYSVDSDVKQNAVDGQLQEDAEIIFKGKAKTDNGLEVGFQVQLEAAQSSDQVDEHYIYVKGGFGKLEIGAENSAPYKIQTTTPKFLGWKDFDNNFKTWSEVSGWDKPLHDEISADANKINYYTPRMNGIQLALAYTPDTSNTSGHGMTLSLDDDGGYEVFSYGISYKGKVGGGILKASYTAEDGEAQQGAGDKEETAFGLNYKNGKFEIGVMSFEQDDNNKEHEALHYGVAYKVTDATTLGFAFHDQERTNSGSKNGETDVLILGGNTKLAKGVKLTYSLEEVESTGYREGDSTFAGVGLLLKF